jgi:hypothetical protein
MVRRQAEGDRRTDQRVELFRGPLADLERDVDIRPQRAVIAVILG